MRRLVGIPLDPYPADALAAMPGAKPYFLGDVASGADAARFGFVATASTPVLDSPIPAGYRERMMGEFFPGFA
jgi:hypothetical protein